jgi:hypothetical protein
MQEYFSKHRANVVVVWMTPSNDLWENTFPDRSTSPEVGRFKPTFKLEAGELRGPFYAREFHYRDSMVRHVLAHSVARILGRPRPEQALLDEWIASLPPASPASRDEVDCRDTTVIEHSELFRTALATGREQRYTVGTPEDVGQGRSHFSPYTTPATPRNDYERQVTKALLQRMKEVAQRHGADFEVLFPRRVDLNAGLGAIRCIETMEHARFGYEPDYERVLKDVVPSGDLIRIDVRGTEDIVVGGEDHHLNELGNAQVMSKLAREIVRLGATGHEQSMRAPPGARAVIGGRGR